MGRIVVQVKLDNPLDASEHLEFSGLVDTGAAYITLPSAWRHRLGQLGTCEPVEMVTATQSKVAGELCGPVRISIAGFRPFHSEILFVDMETEDGAYEALIGYIPLEQCQAAVDMVGHRLLHIKNFDLKWFKKALMENKAA